MGDAVDLGIILGAGRPVRGQQPAALFALSGHGRVLDWLVDALRRHCAEVVFVGGFRFDDVVAAYPSLHTVVNPRWADSGPVASLLRACTAVPSHALVVYADVLVRPGLVQRLAAGTADAVLAIDSRWRQRYDRRSPADLARAEVVALQGGRLLSAHGQGDPRPAAPDAEFVGLARLGPRAMACLQQLAAQDEAVAHWGLPRLFNAWLAAGLAVAVVDCAGDWAELNAPQDVARFILGTKAETLARLRPMVRHSQIGAQVAFTAGQWRADAAACLRSVQQAFGADRLVVRSSAIGEDGFAASGAGRFDSVLDVDGGQPARLRQAVEQVLASYGAVQAEHQVLVQRLVTDIALSGVAMTRTLSHGAPYRVINFDAESGLPDAVTAGRGEALRTLYWHRDSRTLPAGAPAALAGLLPALREIEALVGHDSLDIEFIIGPAGQVHVLQIRPITVDHDHWAGTDDLVRGALCDARRHFRQLQPPAPGVLGQRALFSVMTDWNPAEMIGTRPRRLAVSLYADLITRDVWSRQRCEYGYRSLAPQPLMQGFAGHAYIDVRASLNSFVPADLPDALAERLVALGIDRLAAQPHLHDKVEFELVFSCLTLDFAQRAQGLLDAGFTPDDLALLQASLARLTRRGFDRVAGDLAALDRLAQRQQRVAASGLPPLRQALVLLDDCRSEGTLPFAHLARAGFIAMALLNSAVVTGVISVQQRADYLRSVATVATAYRDDGASLQGGNLTQAAFLERYGHLRPGTYDITVPSYADDPVRYLDLAEAGCTGQHQAPLPWPDDCWRQFDSALAALGLPVGAPCIDAFLRAAIAGREAAKFTFTRSLSRALDQIAAFGRQIGLSRDDLSYLSLTDLRAVDSGELHSAVADELRRRAAQSRLAHALALGIELPPLLRDEADFDGFVQPVALPNFIGTGRVTAAVVCIDDGTAPTASLAGRIVLSRQADPGCDWLFAHGIAGLVTAYGGANSHMAIRAAEFGLPAAIGVGEPRYQQLAACLRLMLDCGQRKVGEAR